MSLRADRIVVGVLTAVSFLNQLAVYARFASDLRGSLLTSTISLLASHSSRLRFPAFTSRIIVRSF